MDASVSSLESAQNGDKHITGAPPPFDKATADVILRSSDLVNFRVRKGILAEASSFFEAMFQLPQPAADASLEESRDGLPVVETAGNAPPIDDLDGLRQVIYAAGEYDMQEVLITLKRNLRSFADTMPVRVYAIALLLKLEDEARAAAKAFLAFPVEEADAPELAEINAKGFNALLKYHRACGAEAARVANRRDWITWSDYVWFTIGRTHTPCASTNAHTFVRLASASVQASEWWTRHMVDSANTLTATPPSKALFAEGRMDGALKDTAA